MIYLVIDTHAKYVDRGIDRDFLHVRKMRADDNGLELSRPHWYNGIEAEPEGWVLNDECHEFLTSYGVTYQIAWVVLNHTEYLPGIKTPVMGWMLGIPDPDVATLFKLTFL